MNNELKLKKCAKCGALVQVLRDCTCENCGIKCCGQEMTDVVANTVECAVEKHKPSYLVEGNKIVASVNHVMEEGHYIEFIAMVAGDEEYKRVLKVGEEAKCEFPYIKGAKLYAYCNKHGLWSADVE